MPNMTKYIKFNQHNKLNAHLYEKLDKICRAKCQTNADITDPPPPPDANFFSASNLIVLI